MKRNFFSVGLVTLVLAAGAVSAQETNEVELLRGELREMRERLQLLERKLRIITEATPGDTRESMAATPAVVAAATNAAPPAMAAWRPADPIRAMKGSTYVDIGMVATFAAGGSTASDIEGGTQLGGHDPNQRGFTVQGAELNLQGAVDTYFRGNANVLFSIDSEGESFVELEEAWLETVSLPGNFQIRAGQLLSDFGRVNTQHPHSWAFVDSPLVNARFLGADGLRNPGARLSWLAPTPFYSELSLGIQDSHGETAASFRSSGHSHGGDEPEGLPFGYRHPDNDRGVRHVTDLLFTPRYAVSFDLTDSQTLVVGASGAFGPNSSGSGGDMMTQIYGADLYWKWKPADAHGGFPFVSFQTEAIVRRYELGAFDWDEDGNLGDGDGNGFVDEGVVTDSTGLTPAGLNPETVTDYGFYSELLYGFRKGWVAGLRYDYVTGQTGDYEKAGLLLADNAGGGTLLGRDPLRDQRWRISPNLTWYPSEFSKVRLQYNYDDRRGFGDDHSVWLQFEFLLGAHAAHKF
jgi:hypothetical protein